MTRPIFKPKPRRWGHVFYLSLIGALFIALQLGYLDVLSPPAHQQDTDLNAMRETKITELESLSDQYGKLREILRIKPLRHLHFINHVELLHEGDRMLVQTRMPIKSALIFDHDCFVGRVIPYKEGHQLLSAFDKNSAILIQLGDYQTLLFGQEHDMALTDKVPLSVQVKPGDTVTLAQSSITPSGYRVGTVVEIRNIPNQSYKQIVVSPVHLKGLPQFASAYSYHAD